MPDYGLIDLQVTYRDGSRAPRAFEDTEHLYRGGAPTLHHSLLPLEESFAGLRLRVQHFPELWTTSPRATLPDIQDGNGGRARLGGLGIVHAAIMRTGWLTYNNGWDTTVFAARWPVEGLQAMIIREQSSRTQHTRAHTHTHTHTKK